MSRVLGKHVDSRRDTAWGACLFLSALLVYLSFLSKSYVFEGLARAMPIEVGRFRNLFNGNYILYGFLGWCFHGFLGLFRVEQLAVTSLQIMDALIGASGLWLFFRLLRRLGGALAHSLLWAAILGTTLGYWRWSTDAEDYILSTFLLLVNFYALSVYADEDRIRPEALGALHALAIMGHIVNAVFAPVVLWFIVAKRPKAWKEPALRYAGTAALLTLAAYAAALAIARPPDPLVWLWGSAARSSAAGGVSFGGGASLPKLWQWVRMTGNILTSYSPSFSSPPSWGSAGVFLWIARACFALLAAALIVRSKSVLARHRVVAVGCCVWLASYALVFTSWQPDTLVYRTMDLPAICLLLFLASRELGRWGPPLTAALALCLGMGNFGAEIFPRSFASNNPDLMRMAFVREHTKESDWVTGGGGRDELYVPYFAQRRPLVIDRFRDHPKELEELLRRERVFITSRSLDDPFWRDYFASRKLKLAASDGKGFSLFRVGLSAQ